MKAIGYVAFHKAISLQSQAEALEGSSFELEAIICDRDGSLLDSLIVETLAGSYSRIVSCFVPRHKLTKKLLKLDKLTCLCHSDSL